MPMDSSAKAISIVRSRPMLSDTHPKKGRVSPLRTRSIASAKVSAGSLIGITLPALTFALAIDRVLNGLTRPFFGWVSDNIGRERTMLIAFALESIGILSLYQFGHEPVAFVILTGIVFFAWGEIYSLFPSTCADTFGSKYAAANAGLLYTAKGTASLLVPLSSVLTAMTGNWHAVFITASIMNAIAALLAWFVLRPMRRTQIESARIDVAAERAVYSN